MSQAEPQLATSKANVQQAGAAPATANAAVPNAEANLVEVKVADELAKTHDDGYVTNWQVQVGTMLVPMPISAAGTFVNVSDTAVAAVFPQNWLLNVESGDDVEMVLNPYPGVRGEG